MTKEFPIDKIKKICYNKLEIENGDVKMIDEKRIDFLMKKLGITREEALELEGYDSDVNKGKKTQYDLPKEKEEVVHQMMRQKEHAKMGTVKRERKPNETKEAIIAELADFLAEDAQNQAYEDVIVANKNRTITFSIGEKRFELNLIEKRPPKEAK